MISVDISILHPRLEAYFRNILSFSSHGRVDQAAVAMKAKITDEAQEIDLNMASVVVLPSIFVFQDIIVWSFLNFSKFWKFSRFSFLAFVLF